MGKSKENNKKKADSEWYIYLIRCCKGSLYTGITTDVHRRFAEHQTGRGARYLKGKGPLKLVFSMKAGTRSQALRLERKIKQLSKDKKELMISAKNDIGATYK